MKDIVITIDKASVMADVRRRLWLAARSAGAVSDWKNPEAVAYMQGGGDVEEDARVEDFILGDLAYLRGRLAEWIEPASSLWSLPMSLPDNYSPPAVEAARLLLPDAIASRAAAEWLMMTAASLLAEIAKVWASEGTAKLNEAIAMFSERARPQGRIKDYQS